MTGPRKSRMTTPRHAVNIPPFTDARTVVDIAVEAEAAGWDGVFLWDHLQWSLKAALPVHDPWVLLGAVVQATERVKVGTLVTPLTRRRVQIVAKHLLTLDHLSDGRVIFGVGLGEPPDADFADFGDEAGARERGRMLDESLDVLDGLLRGDRVDHDGEHLHVHARLRPGPVQRPRPPIWVAGVVPNQRPLERARRWDGVAPIGQRERLTPDVLASYIGSELPVGWDVVAGRIEGASAAEYADAGVTWLTESTWPTGDWVDEFRTRVAAGPRD